MTDFPSFDVTAHLQDGWRVREFSPLQVLEVRQDEAELERRARSQGWVLAISLLLAGYLSFVFFQNAAFAWNWALWPVAALFVLVALFSALALWQTFQKKRLGVFVRLDRRSHLASGMEQASLKFSFQNYRVQHRESPLDDIEAICLRVGSAPKAGEPSRAEVLVRRHNQPLAWQGPTSWALPGDDAAARDALFPLAVAMARIAQCTLKVEYVDSQDVETWTKEELLLSGSA